MGRKSGKDESPEAGEGKNTVKATNAEKKTICKSLTLHFHGRCCQEEIDF